MGRRFKTHTKNPEYSLAAPQSRPRELDELLRSAKKQHLPNEKEKMPNLAKLVAAEAIESPKAVSGDRSCLSQQEP